MQGSPAAALEHLETYLRGVFNFIGIEPEFVAADGLSISPEQREELAQARRSAKHGAASACLTGGHKVAAYMRIVDAAARKEKVSCPNSTKNSAISLDEDQFAFPKERKEPLNNASHVRNAIARFNQVEGRQRRRARRGVAADQEGRRQARRRGAAKRAGARSGKARVFPGAIEQAVAFSRSISLGRPMHSAPAGGA